MADELVFEFRTPVDKLRGDLTQARGLMRVFGAETEREDAGTFRRLSTARAREFQRSNREQLRQHARVARQMAAEYERELGGGLFSRIGRAASDAFRRTFSVAGVGGGGGGILSGGLSVATGNLITSILSGAVDEIQKGIGIGMDFNRLKEATLLGLRRKLGGQRQAEAFFNEVAKFAQDDSPLKIAQAVAQANRLLALNFKPNEIITVLRAAGDAAAGMGKVGDEAQEKVEQITKALADIRGKQRVNAEELSRQLQEAGVSGWRYIAEELRRDPKYARLNESEAIAVARELAEKNRLSADAVVGIIVKGMMREFGGMGREINLNTLAGQEGMTEDLMSVVLGAGTQGLFKHKLVGQRALNQTLQGDAAGRVAGYISAGTDTALTGVENALRSLGLNLPKLGAEGGGSYAEGFKGSAGAAYEAGTAVGGAAEKGVRDKLDQHSPSQVMLALGRDAGQSFVTGFMQGAGGKRLGDEIERIIEEAAARYGIDPNLLRAIMHRESRGRIGAVSPKGASGLMQLMPGTAASLGVKDIFDPRQNIMGGAKYLRRLLDMFGGDVSLALAGYNAGEGAVMKYGNRIPPYGETRAYVPAVLERYRQLSGGGAPSGGAVPVVIQNLSTLKDFFSQFVGKGYTPSIALGHAVPDRPASGDLTGGVGYFAEDFNPRGFAERLYALQKSMPAGGSTSVAALSDWEHTVSMLAEEFHVSRTVQKKIEGMVAQRLEDERRALDTLSGASGGSFRPGSPYANITNDQAQHVLEMMRRARGEGVDATRLGAADLAQTVTPQALSGVRLIAQETKGAFEDLPPLIQKTTKDMEGLAKGLSSIFGGALQSSLRGDFRGLLEGLRDDFTNWTVRIFEDWAKSKIFNALTGKATEPGKGGGLLSGIFGGIGKLFGIGGSAAAGASAAGATAAPAAASAILGGVAPGAGVASVFGGGIATAAFGGGGGAALGLGLGGASAAGGSAAAGGAAAGSSGGLLGSMGALLTNPWTAVAAGGIIAGIALWKHFSHRTEKELRKGIRQLRGVDIKDMSVLQNIKAVGEQNFGQGQVRKRLFEVINLPPVQEIIDEYAAATGQGPARQQLPHEFLFNTVGGASPSSMAGDGRGVLPSPFAKDLAGAQAEGGAQGRGLMGNVLAPLLNRLEDMQRRDDAREQRDQMRTALVVQSNNHVAGALSTFVEASPEGIVMKGASGARESIATAFMDHAASDGKVVDDLARMMRVP